MQNLPQRGPIRPKISTMPRPRSEASLQLDLYKLVTEKQRIEYEIRLIEQRQQQLIQRLGVVEKQMGETEEKIQKIRQSSTQSPPLKTRPTTLSSQRSLKTFYVDY